ncbi:MAG: CHAT domain-containing protein [Leptolyngbyaceae cyanobacterium SM1_3_5]|nr:CHAT domain-containing protein [Leptolyngbyaceae cyanobacterium SM1_3_5]
MNRVEDADELLRKGTDYLNRWLDEIPSPGERQLLALKFAGFNQLTVDRHIQAASQLSDEAAIQAKLKEAWETAEKGKNTCLSWLLYTLTNEAASSNFEEAQQFLSPETAIVYWHLSPAALTTFVLKPGESAPVLIAQPSTGDRPASLQQLLKLEAWMKEWDSQYSDYRRKGKEQRDADHPWRREMAQRLFERQAELGNLKEILNIEAIEQYLNGVDRLILIPHRDLHRFPLHALFDSRWVVSYLPSVRVGLTLQGRKPKSFSQLFSIENPQSSQAPNMRLALLESQVISQYFQNVRSLQEANATHEHVIRALAENHTILHFSGHGSHHFENPRKSALLLAGTESLTLEEICHQDLTTYDLVSLSACETALTNNQSITTEYVGLVSGFLSQGAAQVLSTLWVVKSAVSAVIMIEFYRARRSGKSDAIVLTETIRWFRSLEQPKFEQWCQDCLKDLATLPPKRQSELKRMFEIHIGWQWDTIREDVQHPYAWAAFILSGGFFP